MMTDKKLVRKNGLRARRGMTPEQRSKASAAIVRRISQSDIFRNASTILIYKALPDEVDLSALAELPGSEGKRFCYPRSMRDGIMEALLPSGPDGWKKGMLGITEPDPDTALPVAPDELDLVICPCSAFDESGRRMGMGGGYYDRYLPLCSRAVITAAAFEAQKADSVPAEEWDIGMEKVFTEAKTYYCTAAVPQEGEEE